MGNRSKARVVRSIAIENKGELYATHQGESPVQLMPTTSLSAVVSNHATKVLRVVTRRNASITCKKSRASHGIQCRE